MERVEIDCRSRQVRIFALAPEEETKLIQEREANKQKEIGEQKKIAKQLLVKALAELREMKQNRDVFDDVDLDEKQAEVDALKEKLQ